MELVHSGQPEPEAKPSCPACGGNDTEASKAGFHCGPCNLVFKGSQEEWEKWTYRRREQQDKSHLRSV